jgi:anaphase-promoting complex subunit 2
MSFVDYFLGPLFVNTVISMMLDIHFFRSMLSNRLLSQFSYNTEREIRNLELLKLRFGETSLQQCEVMLKDISDSKRINNAILGEDQPGANVIKLFTAASNNFL